jgi:hypothetical protein
MDSYSIIPPTKEGWYWFYTFSGKVAPRVVRVFRSVVYGDNLYFDFIGHRPVTDKEYAGFWSGPLQSPAPPTQNVGDIILRVEHGEIVGSSSRG